MVPSAAARFPCVVSLLVGCKLHQSPIFPAALLQEISFFEEGEPLIDGEPGDLKFVVRAVQHPRFTRRGDDLYMNHTISLVDALTGFTEELRHLDDHKIDLQSQAVIRPGETQMLKGQGMPLYGREGRFGNLYVTYAIDFPKHLAAEQKATVRQLFS